MNPTTLNRLNELNLMKQKSMKLHLRHLTNNNNENNLKSCFQLSSSQAQIHSHIRLRSMFAVTF